MIKIRKLLLLSWLSPGDIVALTAAIRDLHLTYPGQFLTDVRTSCPELWENNPYIVPLEESEAEVIEMHYPLIHDCNNQPHHFIDGYRDYLASVLNMPIKPFGLKGDIYLREEEKHWLSAVDEWYRTEGGIPDASNMPFWIIVNGGKRDFTAKHWAPERYQEVVDHFKGRIKFVQCGHNDHVHHKLDGVIDLVGKTDLRQVVRLVYHSAGIVCPVTMYMMLAAAVPTRPERPAGRACVVIAGGREPVQWQQFPSHQYLHTIGMLKCCETGGCWKSRVMPLYDGEGHDESLCTMPIDKGNYHLPKCLDMITSQDVIISIEKYLENTKLKKLFPVS